MTDKPGTRDEFWFPPKVSSVRGSSGTYTYKIQSMGLKDMNIFLVILLALPSVVLSPQQDEIWHHVNAVTRTPKLKSVTLSRKQLATVKNALAARVRLDNWPCADGGEPGWIDKVIFEELPISSAEHATLVQAGMGCARGGQGANGAMWVVQFEGDNLSFLATPQQQFNGWLYSIEPTTSHGFQDLVLGWHLSAGEAILSYFRFDGQSYRLVSKAQLLSGKIVPMANP